MANSGPGWEGIEMAWAQMVIERNQAQEREFERAARDAEAAVLAKDDPPASP